MAVNLKGKIPFAMEIDGMINGTVFRVVGQGSGNASDGIHDGKWECTTGNLPLSWSALASTLGYGFKCYTQYPDNVSNFFHHCLPEGYSQERVIQYKSGGTITAMHEISKKDNKIYNKIKLTGIGFPPKSPVLTKNLQTMLPSLEYTYPFANGIRSIVNHVFPYINGEGYEVAEQVTINKPLGSRPAVQPCYHFTHVQIKQTDIRENSVVQDEVSKASLPGYS